MKQCIKCSTFKTFNNFYNSKRKNNTKMNICKDCKIEYQKNYYIINKIDIDAILLIKRDNCFYKEKKKIYNNKYHKDNTYKFTAKSAKYRAAKLQATPKWLTKQQLQEIEQFYIDARELQWLSEEPLEVDHIVPLQGDIICGLHVPWNLQILPRKLNIKKSNKLLDNMLKNR